MARGGFPVQRRQCSTCIYTKNNPTLRTVKELEDEVRDPYVGFKGHRACHHGDGKVCCRGFWDRHKDEFPAGQIAQRLGLVEWVDMDTMKTRRRS